MIAEKKPFIPVDDEYAVDYDDLEPTRSSYRQQNPTLDLTGLRVHMDDDGAPMLAVTTNGLELLSPTVDSLAAEVENDDLTTFLCYERAEIDVLLRPLPISALDVLLDVGRVTLPTTRGNLQIWYAPGSLTLRRRGSTVRIFALDGYFTRLSLETVCKTANIPMKDTAVAVQQLGLRILAALTLMAGEVPAKLSTPSVLFNGVFTKAAKKDPSVPEEVYRMYYETLHAPWVTVFQKGVWDLAFDYDINRAYPTAVGKLPSTEARNGSWEFDNNYRPDAIMGAAICYVRLHRVVLSPILFRYGDWLGDVHGAFIARLTKQEIDFIKKHQLGKCEVLGGWWYLPRTKALLYPFRAFNNRLQAAADASPDAIFRHVIRTTGVRLVGKFLQRNVRPDGTWTHAPTFNPIYAVEAMARVKLDVAEAAMTNPSAVIAISTDGILTSSPLKIPLSMAPGEIRLEGTGRAAALRSNITQITGKDKVFNPLDQIIADPLAEVYDFGLPYRIGLCDAVVRRRRTDAIGAEIKVRLSVSVNSEEKRLWMERPKNGGDLLEHPYRSRQFQVGHAIAEQEFAQIMRHVKRISGLNRGR